MLQSGCSAIDRLAQRGLNCIELRPGAGKVMSSLLQLRGRFRKPGGKSRVRSAPYASARQRARHHDHSVSGAGDDAALQVQPPTAIEEAGGGDQVEAFHGSSGNCASPAAAVINGERHMSASPTS